MKMLMARYGGLEGRKMEDSEEVRERSLDRTRAFYWLLYCLLTLSKCVFEIMIFVIFKIEKYVL